MKTTLEGLFVYLRPLDPEKDAELLSKWLRDGHFDRLADSEPAMMFNKDLMKEWYKDAIGHVSMFMICQRTTDKPLGYIELADFDWHSGNAWMGIGIGEREYWGRGFGLEAIRILLKLAFHEWNLQRVSLGVNGYNERAIRAYEKAGFKLEGSLRNYVQRNGKRWDLHIMGVLRREW